MTYKNNSIYALIKNKGNEPELAMVTVPAPEPHQALVRVICTGLCRTDLLVARDLIPAGKSNLILGHEFCGRVEIDSADGTMKSGDIVAVDPTYKRLDGSDGFMGRQIDGCLATFTCVPTSKLFKTPDGMNFRTAAYIEPVAAAMGGAEEALKSGGNGLLVGKNRIASLTSFLLQDMGLDFIHLSHEEFREGVKSGYYLNCSEWLLESALEDDMLHLGAEALKADGTFILKSRHASSIAFPAARWAERRLNLAGRSRESFPKAMEWLKHNTVRIETLFGPSFPLHEWKKAFSVAEGNETGKVFVMSEEIL